MGKLFIMLVITLVLLYLLVTWVHKSLFKTKSPVASLDELEKAAEKNKQDREDIEETIESSEDSLERLKEQFNNYKTDKNEQA